MVDRRRGVRLQPVVRVHPRPSTKDWSLPFSILLGTATCSVPFLLMWVFRFFSETYVLNIFAQISLVMLMPPWRPRTPS